MQQDPSILLQAVMMALDAAIVRLTDMLHQGEGLTRGDVYMADAISSQAVVLGWAKNQLRTVGTIGRHPASDVVIVKALRSYRDDAAGRGRGDLSAIDAQIAEFKPEHSVTS